MLATAEADVREDTDAPFEPERSTAVAVIECPVQLPIVNDLRAKYGALSITGLDDKAGFNAVDEARKHCKRVRLQVENWRKEQNEEALKHQRRVNAAAKLIREPLELLEDTLAGKQKAITDEVERLKREAEEKAKAEKAAKLKSRMDALHAVRSYQIPSEVEKFTDEGFAEFLAVATKSDQDRIAFEAEEKRQRETEAERQRLENERLAEERRKLDAEKAELERLRREQADREKLLAFADQVQSLPIPEDAEKAELERLRREQADREKLLAFADQVQSLPIPELEMMTVAPLVSFALAVAADKIRKIERDNVM